MSPGLSFLAPSFIGAGLFPRCTPRVAPPRLTCPPTVLVASVGHVLTLRRRVQELAVLAPQRLELVSELHADPAGRRVRSGRWTIGRRERPRTASVIFRVFRDESGRRTSSAATATVRPSPHRVSQRRRRAPRRVPRLTHVPRRLLPDPLTENPRRRVVVPASRTAHAGAHRSPRRTARDLSPRPEQLPSNGGGGGEGSGDGFEVGARAAAAGGRRRRGQAGRRGRRRVRYRPRGDTAGVPTSSTAPEGKVRARRRHRRRRRHRHRDDAPPRGRGTLLRLDRRRRRGGIPGRRPRSPPRPVAPHLPTLLPFPRLFLPGPRPELGHERTEVETDGPSVQR